MGPKVSSFCTCFVRVKVMQPYCSTDTLIVDLFKSLPSTSIDIRSTLCESNSQSSDIVQSAGVVEYADCTSAEGYYPPPPPMIVLDTTLNNMMMRFCNAGALGNTDYLVIAIALKSTLTRSGST